MSQMDQICTLLRKSRGLSYQTRWNMYPKTRRESIAEHTFNVALFALMILYIKSNYLLRVAKLFRRKGL